MLKALFKKQLMEVNAWLIQDKRRGKARGRLGRLLLALAFAVLFCVLGAVFYEVGDMLGRPLVSLGLDWLYFSIMGLMAIMLGVFGSVFNTYATLYRAKDNEFLLSLPIAPSRILLVRLFAVWMWSLIYEATVFLPALIAFWQIRCTPVCVACGLWLMLMLSVFILTLSCVLGWVVAKVSAKVKNKSLATVLLSLAGMGLYFLFLSRSYELLQSILLNALMLGTKIRGSAWPLYLMGSAGAGGAGSALMLTLLIAMLFLAVCWVMNRTFLRLATAHQGAEKEKRRVSASRPRGLKAALLFKERRRFFSSSVYMLNCGLGTVMTVALGAAALVKADWIRGFLAFLPGESAGLAPLSACAMLCAVSAMNDISAPSVSLEGKNLWLLQSLPVPPWQALAAKLRLHLWITEPAALFCAGCLVSVIRPGPLAAVLMMALPALFTGLCAAFGLAVNLKLPNLQWTDETIPVKQSVGVVLSIMGGWLCVVGLTALYFAVRDFLSAEGYLLLCAALIGLLTAALRMWLKRRGARIFTAL